MDDISEREIMKAIKKLKDKKAAGEDEIMNEIIKENAELLVKPLGILFNKIWEEGKIPRELKKAVVVPIYKGKTRKKMVNYIIYCIY